MNRLITTLALVAGLVSSTVFAGEISDIFGEGVFSTKWGQSVKDVQVTYPNAELKKSGKIINLEIEDGRRVLDIGSDKIVFAFDSENRLIGVAVYYDTDKFGDLLSKLTTNFGPKIDDPLSGILIKWPKDNDVKISLSMIPILNASLFGVEYQGLEKPKKDKEELGF